MSPLLKNIFVGIICLILLGFAYFFLIGSEAEDGSISNNEEAQVVLINKTKSFIERSRKLQAISIDTAFFNNPAFTSLRSFSTEVVNQPLGKNDIFSTAVTIPTVAPRTEEEAE